MHHKFLIIDNSVLITGSFNWTRQAIVGNHENLIVTTHAKLVPLYRREFDKLWIMFDPKHRGTSLEQWARVDCYNIILAVNDFLFVLLFTNVINIVIISRTNNDNMIVLFLYNIFIVLYWLFFSCFVSCAFTGGVCCCQQCACAA